MRNLVIEIAEDGQGIVLQNSSVSGAVFQGGHVAGPDSSDKRPSWTLIHGGPHAGLGVAAVAIEIADILPAVTADARTAVFQAMLMTVE